MVRGWGLVGLRRVSSPASFPPWRPAQTVGSAQCSPGGHDVLGIRSFRRVGVAAEPVVFDAEREGVNRSRLIRGKITLGDLRWQHVCLALGFRRGRV